MLMSKMFLQTLKESPKEAEIVSHNFMIRANMMKKLASGIYNFLPLGLKVLKKVENIVREEMDKAGCQEIICSALQPKELWDESGRWDKYGKGLITLKDRHEREYCLGPTHEEIFTDIVRDQIRSYKQLPINLYQIQTKYRDETRPRFGLIRSREFIMKDAYSFDIDEIGLDNTYNDMYKAYSAVFDRCGLTWKAVLADTGAIGGSDSHQFMALSDVGESDILYCSECNYSADREKAEFMVEKTEYLNKEATMGKIYTPNQETIKEIANFLSEPEYKMAKSVVYNVDGKIVLAVIRGDREVNKVKFCNTVGVDEETYDDHVQMASESDLAGIGSIPGFIGPVGLKNVEIVVDREIEFIKNVVVGANEKDYHLKNVCYGRDFVGKIADIVNASEGDKCPQCGKSLKMERGTEVGQLFKLGTKYSEAMNCNYTDENGTEKPMVMGCYGIGVSRTISSIIEQNHDDNGIIWPISVAPYHVDVVPVNIKDEIQMNLAKDIYQNLMNSGIEVVLDDRDERPGVKFKDADLIGFPIRITVGKKAAEGIVEFKERIKSELKEISVDDIQVMVNNIINK